MQTGKECVICGDVITTPICADCLGREVEAWLRDNRPELIKDIRIVIDTFGSFTHKATKCVVCGSQMSICPHCVSMDILMLLRTKDIELAKEFKWLFNFDLRGLDDEEIGEKIEETRKEENQKYLTKREERSLNKTKMTG